jgi:hypothetical protein
MFLEIKLEMVVKESRYDYSHNDRVHFEVDLQDISLVEAIDLNAIKAKLAQQALSVHYANKESEEEKE